MEAEFTPVENNDEKALDDERGEERDDTEVPHLRRVEANDARGALSEEQAQQYAESRDHAVCGDEDGTEVEEDRMHLSKDRASECARGRIRPTGP
jgi:hypothetical protein